MFLLINLFGRICQATASEVQNLLASGRKMEALQCAQEGHLWGPALVIAAQLGQQVLFI